MRSQFSWIHRVMSFKYSLSCNRLFNAHNLFLQMFFLQWPLCWECVFKLLFNLKCIPCPFLSSFWYQNELLDIPSHAASCDNTEWHQKSDRIHLQCQSQLQKLYSSTLFAWIFWRIQWLPLKWRSCLCRLAECLYNNARACCIFCYLNREFIQQNRGKSTWCQGGRILIGWFIGINLCNAGRSVNVCTTRVLQ